MTKITLKDISQALKLSTSTISKALNNSYEISDETKQIVLNYVKEHNYQPNRLAKSLKSGKTNTIGVIACSINNTFFSQVFEGIQQAAIENNYEVIMMQSLENEIIEKKALDSLLFRSVDGILIAPVSENSNVELLQNIHENICPIILFDRISSKINTHKVGSNDFIGAYNATKQLIDINRKKIIFIRGSKFSEDHQRILGYKKSLKDHNIPYNEDYILSCDLDDLNKMDQQIKEGISDYLSRKIIPNAIIGATDVITTRALGILAEMDIKVPDQFAVIGFSNTDIAFSLNPSLSTIRQPADRIGYLALSKMIELIDNKSRIKEYDTILLDTTIQLRNSTKIYH